MTLRALIGNRTGITITELILATAIFVVMSLISVKIYQSMRIGVSLSEGKGTVKSTCQRSINQVHRTLIQSVRLFDNANGFLASVQMSSSPVPLGGSQLSTDQVTLSPSSPTFVTSSVGNSLFFAAVSTSPAQVSVVDPATPGIPHTIRIDSYSFEYFYLSNSPLGGSVGGKPRLALYQSSSPEYVDFNELFNISNVTLQQNVVSALYAQGYRTAFQVNGTAANTSFFTLGSGGSLTADPSHTIPIATNVLLTTGLGSGVMSNIRVSVCPNTSGMTINPGVTVPVFGAASGSFPGGFEVVVAGPSGARQVHTRLALLGEGSFPGVVGDVEDVTSTIRDSW